MNGREIGFAVACLAVVFTANGMARLPAVYDVMDYGAKGDGETLDTVAVQSAIDACKPGGVVQVGKGRYVVGTLKLKSDMELHVAEEAELLGSISLSDYATDNQGAIEAPAFNKCLLYAENARNIRITGAGVIDGRGTREHFPVKLKDGTLGKRPMLIRFVDCQDITFSGITLKNAASWCTHLVSCDDIVVQNVTIDSHVNTNNDGFDMDGCANVLIENCNILTGDDAICPKSTTEKLCEKMVVKNCRVKSHTAAFKCGTSSHGGFRNITISDCDFSGCRMGVIKLLSVDGGLLENITISNIVMDDVEGPIFIRLGNRNLRGRLAESNFVSG
jgi:polygalacturonase